MKRILAKVAQPMKWKHDQNHERHLSCSLPFSAGWNMIKQHRADAAIGAQFEMKERQALHSCSFSRFIPSTSSCQP